MMDKPVIEFFEEDQIIRFLVENPNDTIQREHAKGSFYEKAELEMIRLWFPQGGVFFDIGANVGNHAIYAAKVLKSDLVICVEPNPEAIKIFRSNRQINEITDMRMPLHEIALANEAGTGILKPRYRNNLGAAQVFPSNGVSVEDGHTTVPLATGDSIATDTIIDFIKIDVEGLALEVLSGLELTIARNRPAMFIELDDKDSCSFETWLEEANYRIVGCLVRYETQTNYIVIPQEMKKPPIHPSAKS